MTDNLSKDFLKRLGNYLRAAGYRDSSLFDYLCSNSNELQPKTIDIPDDEAIFTFTLIKFFFLFDLNRSFYKDILDADFRSKKSIADINELLSMAGFQNNTDNARKTFIEYHKITFIDDEKAEKDYRFRVYRLLDYYLSEAPGQTDIYQECLKKCFTNKKIPKDILNDYDLNKSILSSEYLTDRTIANVNLALGKFLNILFPELDEAVHMRNRNARKLRRCRAQYKNRNLAPHVRPETARMQTYERSDLIKFESDLARFLDTYTLSNDYEATLSKFKKK